MNFFDILTLIGGLAFFLYGMSVMGDGLEKRSAGSLKTILGHLTSNPFKGLLLGIAVTAIIQSSSATTVMLVGFVNAGVMQLSQTIGVIMGANVGATFTPWLLSLSAISGGSSFFINLLKPSSFSPVLAMIGLAMFMSKSSKRKDTGIILLGFSILMFGMETMAGAVSGLSESDKFAGIMLMFSNPLLGILVGALVTAVIQSSSASIGILQALSTTGSIEFASAIPIVLGQNIGTCITAILSSIGANKPAKRVAAVHLLFNVIGSVFFIAVFYLIKSKLSFVNTMATPVGIAVFNTVYKIATTIVLYPFSKQLEKLACRIVPDGAENDEFNSLDERFFDAPALAVNQCKTAVSTMMENAERGMELAVSLIDNFDEASFSEVETCENKTDKFEDKLGSYLIKLTQINMTVDDSREVTELLHLIGDIERIGDHALNIAEAAQEINDKKIQLSDDAREELHTMGLAVHEILSLSIKAFNDNDMETALKIEPLEQVVDNLKIILKNHHVERLKLGRCSIETGFVFSDIITNFERVADHCSNIAVCMLQMKNDTYSAHEYINSIKNSDDLFAEQYEAYKKKYNIITSL